jgi:hypothetical protein
MEKMTIKESRHHELGEGSFKIIVFLVVVLLGGFAASQYVPVAYNAASLKQEMQTIVDQSSAVPAARENQAGWVEKKLTQVAPTYGVPADAQIIVQNSGDAGITASVNFTAPVSLLPFGIYTYPYEFKHTTKTSAMLTK